MFSREKNLKCENGKCENIEKWQYSIFRELETIWENVEKNMLLEYSLQKKMVW